ncbi:hypothetical protein L1987_28076 [Smallanthus sonchifolius]|uniref:Uncharacterized protein n=1 Tax=Smallanthus sonchifolius TaxID=185202 RepID=A0ACB9IBE0_9ASTR|nr:hypothetical protein L1987_28076 [Smallanthus sonchifolius]
MSSFQVNNLSFDIPVLIKKAEKFEWMELQKIIVNRDQLLILEKQLNDAYVIRRPKPSEYEHRKQVIRVLNDIAKDLYGAGRVQKVEPIMGAKVPILKFVDTATRVECDISVENKDGISKSLIIRLLASIDERFQRLSFLSGGLSNESKLMVFKYVLKGLDGTDGEDPTSMKNSVRSFQNYGRRNTKTLGELFVSYVIKKVSHPNGVMDMRAGSNLSTMPLPTGHWGVPQHQACLEIPCADQWLNHQPTQRWGSAWGGPGWTQGWGGGASTGSWFGPMELFSWMTTFVGHKRCSLQRTLGEEGFSNILMGILPTCMVNHFVESRFPNEANQIAPVGGFSVRIVRLVYV